MWFFLAWCVPSFRFFLRAPLSVCCVSWKLLPWIFFFYRTSLYFWTFVYVLFHSMALVVFAFLFAPGSIYLELFRLLAFFVSLWPHHAIRLCFLLFLFCSPCVYLGPLSFRRPSVFVISVWPVFLFLCFIFVSFPLVLRIPYALFDDSVCVLILFFSYVVSHDVSPAFGIFVYYGPVCWPYLDFKCGSCMPCVLRWICVIFIVSLCRVVVFVVFVRLLCPCPFSAEWTRFTWNTIGPFLLLLATVLGNLCLFWCCVRCAVYCWSVIFGHCRPLCVLFVICYVVIVFFFGSRLCVVFDIEVCSCFFVFYRLLSLSLGFCPLPCSLAVLATLLNS